MKMRIFFLLILTCVIIFAFNVNEFNMNSFFESKDTKFQPDTATNLQIHTFSHYYPINSTIVFFSNARKGNGSDDTLYTGTGRVEIFEETRDSSAFSFSIFAADTGEFFPYNGGACFFAVLNSDTEMVSLRIADSTDNIKSSFFTSVQFREKADTATCLRGFNDTLLTFDFPLRFFFRFEDDSGKIYFDYAALMTDSTLRITVLDNADSSITIASFNASSHNELYPEIINGGYYVEIACNVVRDFDIVFEPILASPPVSPDTIHFVCLPVSESPMLVTFSFSGYNQTIGMDKSLLALNMGENGPMASNNTSLILGEIYDMTGKGASITPSGALTMKSGIAQYVVNCDSVNECIVLKTTESGIPDLVNITPFITLKFKHLNEAVKGIPAIAQVAIAGDTIEGKVYITDAYENLDSSYKGFADFGPESDSLKILNYLTYQYDDYVPINNGVGDFLLTHPFPDTTLIRFVDGEGGTFSEAYFSANGFDGEELYTIWLNGTNTPYERLELFVEDKQVFLLYENALVSVAAMKDDSICQTYSGYASITLSGNAYSPNDSVYIADGVGTFSITDSIAETVTVTVDDGAFSDTDTLYFASGDEAVMIVVAGSQENIVNETFDFTFFAMTPSMSNDITYNGMITIEILDDNGDTNSFTCDGDITAIPIVNGNATASFSNSDAEIIGFSGYSVSEPDTIPLESIDISTTYYLIPSNDSILLGSADTLYIYIIDDDSLTANYNTILDSIYIEESIVNGSVTVLSPYNPISITNGVGMIIITDTENEDINIYGEYSDTLIDDANVYKLLFELQSLNSVRERMQRFPDKDYLQNPRIITNNSAIIKFGLCKNIDLSLSIYDKTGRLIKRLYDGHMNRGHYLMKWDGKDNENNNVSNGIYFLYMNTGESICSNKIILTR